MKIHIYTKIFESTKISFGIILPEFYFDNLSETLFGKCSMTKFSFPTELKIVQAKEAFKCNTFEVSILGVGIWITEVID